MFLTHYRNGNFFYQESELSMMNVKIKMTLKNKITTVKRFSKIRQMAIIDLKFDLKTSLENPVPTYQCLQKSVQDVFLFAF